MPRELDPWWSILWMGAARGHGIYVAKMRKPQSIKLNGAFVHHHIVYNVLITLHVGEIQFPPAPDLQNRALKLAQELKQIVHFRQQLKSHRIRLGRLD